MGSRLFWQLLHAVVRAVRSPLAIALISLWLPAAAPAAAQTSDNSWLAPPSVASRAAAQSAARGNRIAREVLALYDSRREPAPDRTRIHRYLEMPLNHLGLTVGYWDVAGGSPDAEMVRRQRAIVTWFDRPFPEAASYLDWAARLAAAGMRFVVLEQIGAEHFDAGNRVTAATPDELAKVNALMARLGLQVAPRWIGSGEAGAVVTRDAAMVDFEAKLGPELPGYVVTEIRGGGDVRGGVAAGVKSHLVVDSKPSRLTPTVRSALIVTGPGGGYAATGYLRHWDPVANRLSWIIDPFAFLTAALGIEQMPIPDTTTVSGRRLYLSHVDGDGWNSPSSAAPGTAGEIVTRELIAPHPDLPVTVGLIAADVDPALGGSQFGADVARQLYALPQVEAASHTLTSPLRWQEFEAYDRERELGRVIARRASALRAAAREPKVLGRFAARDYAMQSERAFQATGSGMPRVHMQRAFDIEQEVGGALAALKTMTPGFKPASLYLWSGDMRPFEAAIRAARAAGARNLNGGESRLDGDFPSIMYVSPIGRPVGRERQIYAVDGSDTSYTNGWRGPFDGQLKLAETWRNTEAPRRLKPVDLAYHMYAGTRAESLAAIGQLLAIVRGMPVAPVSASRYAAIADGFYDVEIARLAPLKWRVANRGALQTVRFDDAAGLYVDMRQSQGVLGFTHHGRSLYVALDEAAAEATVALTNSRPEPRRQDRPYLVESRWLVSRLKIGTCGFEADAQGFGVGEMTWSGVRPGNYTVSLASEGNDVEVATETSVDGSGELRVALKGNAIPGGRLKVTCSRASPLHTGSVTR